jgi:two-component system nitrogen regulation sensor histidine kinase NtrY
LRSDRRRIPTRQYFKRTSFWTLYLLFGLVNFNIILVLFLLFLIFRNVVKVFAERRGRIIGSSLRAKLVASFAAFSFVPTALMFLISVFYINSSFEKWFSAKMAGVLRDALEVTNAYYAAERKRNYHFADLVSKQLQTEPELANKRNLSKLVKTYQLDVIEYYPNLFDDRMVEISKERSLPKIPAVSLEFLRKGIESGLDAGTIHQFEDGNLVRVIVPVGGTEGAIVVSSVVPLSLISQMDEIASAYDDFRNINPLEYPVKSIYLIILFLMTLVIFFAATWLGFHLASQLATPLQKLGEAIRKVAMGSYQKIELQTGSQEIGNLIDSFNQMTEDLARSQGEVLLANESLKTTLNTLDDHNRYIETVLSNVSAGVISVDSDDTITTINFRAGKLLGIDSETLINKSVRHVLNGDYLEQYKEIRDQLSRSSSDQVTKELNIKIGNEPLLLSLSVVRLTDEKHQERGLVFVFDDLTPLINAQRSAAWREVAKRIAHEIKNPLTPIKLSAQRLNKKFGESISDPAFEACTSTIIKQVDELKNLVNEFSQFARLPQAKFKNDDLNKLINETVVLYQTGHKDFKFHFAPKEDLPVFSFDAEQIRRVVSNLLENAVAAVDGQLIRQIEISTDHLVSESKILLKVRDTGSGIPESLMNRIFEPYITTKESGTGLGLSIVKKIVEEHQGTIRAFSAPGQGTTMEVRLPLSQSNQHGIENPASSNRDGSSSDERS